MPEGPEVRAIADVLKQAEGLNLKRINITQDKKYKFARDGIEGEELLSKDRIWTIQKVTTKGKLIIIAFDNGIHALNTLGMTGTWRKATNGKHGRLRLDMTNGENFLFEDQRSFGTFKIVDREGAFAKFKTIGWDLLRCPMPTEDWKELRKKKSVANKPIAQALMEQKHFSGIGNIYKAEILYELRINPTTLVKDLDPYSWQIVNLTAHRIMKNSYEAGGSSIATYRADGKAGSFQSKLKIYGKKKCPAGHDTDKIKQGGRTTWYCKQCLQDDEDRMDYAEHLSGSVLD